MSKPWEDYASTEAGPWTEYERVLDPSEYDPTSPEWQAKYGPTQGNSFLANARIGAGKLFTDLMLGGQQIVGAAPPEAAADKRATDAAIMQTGGGKVGYGGAAIAAGVPVVMAAGPTVPGAAFASGLFGALQPAESMGERYLNTGTAAGWGALGQYGADKLAAFLGRNVPANFVAPTPEVGRSYAITGSASGAGAGANSGAAATGVSNASANVSVNPQVRFQGGGYNYGRVGPDPSAGLTATQQEVAKKGREMGMRLTPGQASGSRALQQLEAKAESQPMSSGPFNAIKDNNQRVLNRKVAEAIGENSDVVDARVLAAADERLGQVFESVRSSQRISIADPAKTKTFLDGIDDDIAGLVDGSIRDNKLVARLESVVGTGAADGRQLGQLSSKLGRAAFKQMSSPSGDRDLGIALYRVKDYVDDMVSETLTGAEKSAYEAARRQWRNLANITSRVGVVNPSSGNVNGVTLANMLQTKDKGGFLFGKNQSDLYNVARFAQAFKPIVGDSGTATRSPLPSAVEFVFGVPINLAARAYARDSVSAAAGAGARAYGATVNQLWPVLNAGRAGFNNSMAAGGQAFPYGLPGLTNALLYGDR